MAMIHTSCRTVCIIFCEYQINMKGHYVAVTSYRVLGSAISEFVAFPNAVICLQGLISSLSIG
jgi:hypothetical protein